MSKFSSLVSSRLSSLSSLVVSHVAALASLSSSLAALRAALLLGLISLGSQSYGAEEIVIDFSYERNVNIGTVKPVLKLAAFTDDRGLADSKLITVDYSANMPVSELVRDALKQGFEKGGVSFVEEGEDMQIVGTLVSSELSRVDRAGVPSIQLTLRTAIELRGGGRSIWSTTLFGRGTVAEEEGMAAAMHAALERSVRELLRDDYFLLEIQ